MKQALDQACLLVGSNVQPAKLFLFDQQLLEPNLWRYADCAVPCAEVLSEYNSDSGKYLRRCCFAFGSFNVYLRKKVTY
jgi:hypothetical protein